MSRRWRQRSMLAGAAVATTRAVGPDAQVPRKDSAAAVSIASNAILIVLKLAAAAVTGSIAILTEAAHSSIDLIASVVAFYSVRKADEPADEDHPYGHQKVENLAAAIEGMLILIGAGVIVFESVRRLAQGSEIESIGIGIAVIAFSALANLVVSAYLYRRARATDSPALEGDAAHLRADAFTSTGVLAGLALVEITGIQAFDPATALLVAAAIVFSGLRILNRSSRELVDQALPPEELDAGPPGDRGARRARGGGLPQAARAPGRQPPPHRPPRAVPRGHQPAARPRDQPRAPGRDHARGSAARTC